jgi:hypothetical protein
MGSKNGNILMTLDSRIINTILAIVTIAMCLLPVALPVAVETSSQRFYDAVAGLQAGDIVMFHNSFTPEILTPRPGQIANVKQLVAQGVKIVAYATAPGGEPTWSSAVEAILEIKPTAVEGEDYVFLGFVPGEEAAQAALAADLWAAAGGVDWQGVSLSSYPLMANVHSANDIDMLIIHTTTNVDTQVRQWNAPYGVPIVVSCTALTTPTVVPYYPTQVLGILNGLSGMGQYEFLSGYAGLASVSSNGVSGTHLTFVIFVVIANIGVLLARSGKAEVAEGS